jgi:hypothetical protein
MMEQMNLFDAAGPINEPRYRQGDYIYKITLDVMRTYVVDEPWAHKVDIAGEYVESGHTLWRYHLTNTSDGGHDVFGEYAMNGIYFDSLDAAKERAQAHKLAIEGAGYVLRADALAFTEKAAFEKTDGKRPIVACIARVGARGIYVQRFYAYPFLYVYETEAHAIRKYRKCVGKFMSEAQVGALFVAEDMYRVVDGQWSHYKFAERNSDWGCVKSSVSKRFSLYSPADALSADDIQTVLAEQSTKTAQASARVKHNTRDTLSR